MFIVVSRLALGLRRQCSALAITLPLAVATSLISSACGAGMGQYTWYNELPKSEAASQNGEYILGLGDTIQVQVYEQETMTTTAKIRSDGRIGLAFVGEIVAVGKHPSDLARELAARLREFIVSPRVTVNVVQSQAVVVTTLGELGHVGAITLENQTGLIEAIALAGGFSDYADRSAIFVIRKAPEYRKIRFTWEALLQNKDNAAAFQLQSGDIILVQ